MGTNKEKDIISSNCDKTIRYLTQKYIYEEISLNKIWECDLVICWQRPGSMYLVTTHYKNLISIIFRIKTLFSKISRIL